MAGKREKKNNRLKRLLTLGILLMATGGLLSMEGVIPLAAGSAEEVPETVPVQMLQPEQGIVPVALPEELAQPDYVEELPQETPLDPEKPMVALTFDDGPGDYTNRLLDIFQQYDARATFFVVGRNIEKYQEVLQRTAEEHEIGSHSWSHPQMVKLRKEGIAEQITKTRDKIFEVTGVETRLMRPPYGAHNKAVREIAAEQDTILINWSVDPKDWQLRNSEKVYQAVMSRVKDGDIILCHDIHETTVDAMERMIPDLIAQGYQLVTVSELLTMRAGEMIPGTVYLKGEPS